MADLQHLSGELRGMVNYRKSVFCSAITCKYCTHRTEL